MMRLNFATLFLLFISFSFAQELEIKFPVNNYIYAKVDNPIRIIGCLDFNEIEVTTENVEIRGEKGIYILKAKTAGVAYVHIYNKKSKSTQTIPVRVRPFPTPKVRLNRNYGDGRIKEALIRSRWLETENFEMVCWSVNDSALITFNLTVINSGKVHRFKNQKNKFSEEIRSLFKKLKKDDLVVFYNIKLKESQGKVLILNDLVCEIE